MAQSYVERELKFDVEPDFSVPDLAGLLPAGAHSETSVEELTSAYFDTPDHALLRSGMTLRYRTGSTDLGWQLKVPHGEFREEIRVGENGGYEVPDDVAGLLRGVRLGQPLVPVATLTTHRLATRWLDQTGRLLAEIDDDTVRACASGDGATASTWREVEIELGDAPEELLSTLAKRFRRAGALPAASSSKLERALPESSLAVASVRPTKGTRAGDVVAAYIAEQQRMILSGDLALRRGDGSVIHKTRVATRRLRSTLRVFGALFDVGRATSLDAELRWYAALLGEIRDRQVLQGRLDAMVSAIDDDLLLGPVRARIDAELGREQAEHWDELQRQLTEPRYLALLGEIQTWVRTPPVTARARKPAAVIGELVGHAERAVSRRLKKANTTGDILLLHSARKSAKRARYAAEAAMPVIGRKAAAREALRYQTLQDVLGEHQDSLVSADLLRRLGAKAGTIEGENGFAFGILHEREQQNAHAARDRARRIARKYS